MRKYRVLLPLLVNGEHKQGDVFEHEFDSADDEQTNLESGLLELVPCKYKNISEDSRVWDSAPGEEFEAALTMGQEAHLIDGGFIERVEDEPAPKPAATTTRKKKEAK